MKINGIIISEEKLAEMVSVMPEESLRNLYVGEGLSDREISSLCGLSDRDVSRLRKVFGIPTDQQYQLRRNPLRFVPLTREQQCFLHGSLFGDSCIAVQSSGTGYWRCRHSTKQEDYLQCKANLMQPFTSSVSFGKRPFEKGGCDFGYVDAWSYALPQFTEFREKFYPDGEKVLTLKLLSEMTPEGFAFWYFDDGCTTGYGFDITTFAKGLLIDEEGTKNVFANVLGLTVSVHTNNGEGRIRILRNSYDRAWEYIRHHIVRGLEHKIPFRYRSTGNQQPSLAGNRLEGSETGGSLSPVSGYGDNTHLKEVTLWGTPGTPLGVVIQSDLVSNDERRDESPARLLN